MRRCLGAVDAAVVVSIADGQVVRHLTEVRAAGIFSIAVVLIHSYTFPDHEQTVKKIAKDLGFTQISLSSETMPMVRRARCPSIAAVTVGVV